MKRKKIVNLLIPLMIKEKYLSQSNLIAKMIYLLNIPLFQDIVQYNYELDSGSVAIDLGLSSTVWDDLRGRPRDERPDLGAYEKLNP